MEETPSAVSMSPASPESHFELAPAGSATGGVQKFFGSRPDFLGIQELYQKKGAVL